jgi:hypothetical protein
MSAESNQVANSATPPTAKKRGRPKKAAPLAAIEESVPVNTRERFHPEKANRRGFSGQCVKVKIIRNPNEASFDSFVKLSCGELPKVSVRPNVPVIIPIEAYNTLLDTTIEVVSAGTVGPDEERQIETLVRIPHQYLGAATWEEYEAFLAENRSKPLNPPKNR